MLYPHIFTTKKINNNTYSPSQINERQSSQDTCTLLAGGIVPDLDDTVNILSVFDFVVVAKVHVPTIPPPPGLALLERLPREDTDRGGGGAWQCKHVPTTVSSSSSSISSMAFNKVPRITGENPRRFFLSPNQKDLLRKFQTRIGISNESIQEISSKEL